MPAAKISHKGAPAAIKGNAVNCAEPAYTSSDIAAAVWSVNPDLDIATPVTIPQMVNATKPGAIARRPSKNAARFCSRREVRETEVVNRSNNFLRV